MDTKQNLDNIQTYIDFVKTNLEPLAQQLKVGVDFLWGILVKQAQVEAIVYLVIYGLLILTAVGSGFAFFYYFKRARYADDYASNNVTYVNKKTGKTYGYWDFPYGEDKDKDFFKLVDKTNKEAYLCTVLGILFVLHLVAVPVTIVSTLPTTVTGLVNPEYRAIEKIVDFAKPKVEEATGTKQ